MYTIYCIKCPIEHACYIGQTYRDMLVRYEEHWETSTRKGYTKYPLYQAFNKYGRDFFYVESLGVYYTAEQANIYELYFVAKYSWRRTLYNQLRGGGYKSIADPTKVNLYELQTHKLVATYDSYWDAARKMKKTNTEIVVAAIDHIPIGRYWISFSGQEHRLWYTLRKVKPIYEQNYWDKNYSPWAMKEKERRHINLEAYSYGNEQWHM